MTVTMKLFAAVREIVGREAVAVELPVNATVGQLRLMLGEQYPQVQTLLRRSAIAVNHDYAEDARVIHEGDEIAVIPPVSGG